MLKLWGRVNSSNVKKVRWTCAELDIPYERIDAGLHFGINNTPEFKAMNPMAMIPVIDDDGFILWESNAIVRYLCAKHPKAPYYPDDLCIRAAADRWMDFQQGSMSVALGQPFMQLIRSPQAEWDMSMITKGITRSSELWKIVDQQLGKTKWLAGDDFTMGDVPLAILAYTWMELPLEKAGLAELRPKLDNVWRWYDQLMAMKNYRDIVAIGLT